MDPIGNKSVHLNGALRADALEILVEDVEHNKISVDIFKNGKKVAVMISAEHYEALKLIASTTKEYIHQEGE